MATHGFVALWIDNASKEMPRALQVINEKWPNCPVQYLTPRFFDGPLAIGMPWKNVLAIVLATDNPAIHEAYKDVTDKPVEVIVPPAALDGPMEDAMRCLVYVDADWEGNVRADFLKTTARQNFPGHSLMVLKVQGFDKPFAERVGGVVVDSTYPLIANAYLEVGVHVVVTYGDDALKMTSKIDTNMPLTDTGESVVDVESAQAILSLPEDQMAALLADCDGVFLHACADLEASGANRKAIHQILHDALAKRDDLNPHLSAALDVPEEGEAQESSPEDETVQMDTSRDVKAIAALSVRKIENVLPELTVDELILLLEAEEMSQNRPSVIQRVQRRLDTIANGPAA